PRLPWPARDSHPARQRDDRDKTAGRPPVSRGHDDDDEKTRFFAAPRAADTAAAGAEEDASGGDDPVVGWLVIVEGPGRGRSCELGAGANSIGRDASQKICLDFGDQEIHREKHTVIVYDPRSRRFFLQPGEARNLTYLGDDVVLAPTPLKGGEIISIGRTQLRCVPRCGEDFSRGQQRRSRALLPGAGLCSARPSRAGAPISRIPFGSAGSTEKAVGCCCSRMAWAGTPPARSPARSLPTRLSPRSARCVPRARASPTHSAARSPAPMRRSRRRSA